MADSLSDAVSKHCVEKRPQKTIRLMRDGENWGLGGGGYGGGGRGTVTYPEPTRKWCPRHAPMLTPCMMQ